jgi:tetratricopeptide (TPR) repeat protein
LSDYNKALSLCKDYPELWYAKADLLYNIGRIRESLLGYRMVTRLEPSNAEAWLDYGETLFELGYLKQALKAFERSANANPYSAEPHYSRAKVLLVLNRLQEAVQSFKNSFLLDPRKRKEFEQEFPGVRSMREFQNLIQN